MEYMESKMQEQYEHGDAMYNELERLQQENQELKAQVPQWISIKDRLPEEGYYLFNTKTAGINSGFIHEHVLSYKNPEVIIDGKGRQFTHWMPLPKEPEE